METSAGPKRITSLYYFPYQWTALQGAIWGRKHGVDEIIQFLSWIINEVTALTYCKLELLIIFQKRQPE